MPVRASAGTDNVSRTITSGRTNRVEATGCGPLLINAGQTGYFRTLYTAAQAQALQKSFTSLTPVDQYGLLTDNLALSQAAYQPMATGLEFLAAVQPNANPKVVQEAVKRWGDLYDSLDGNPAAQTEIAARFSRLYRPALQQLGFVPHQGDTPMQSLLRPTLIGALGKYQDPAVVAEANRLFSAWQADSNAIPGSLKETWLRVIARNADAAKWEVIHAKAKAATGAVERTALYQLLGRTKDEALARRALDLALTDEPG